MNPTSETGEVARTSDQNMLEMGFGQTQVAGSARRLGAGVLRVQKTRSAIFFGKANVDGVVSPRILGGLPVLAGFSSNWRIRIIIKRTGERAG